VQLQSLLEQRFGLELGDDQMAQAATLGELRALTGTSKAVSTMSFSSVTPHAAAAEVEAAPAHPSPMGIVAPSPVVQTHRYPRWTWSAPVNALRVAVQELAIRPLVWLLGAPRVERRSSSPAKPPLLIIANHITAYDVPLILYALPPHLLHRVAVAMSGEMLLDFRHRRGASSRLLNPLLPIAYWLITIFMNVFPLPRLGGFRRSFEHAGRALDRGYSVIIFPEGHRSADGMLQPFRSGIGLLAQQAEADVLPVALVGMDKIIKTRKRWFHAGRISVRVGQPIPYDPHSTPEQTTQKLQAAMGKLLA